MIRVVNVEGKLLVLEICDTSEATEEATKLETNEADEPQPNKHKGSVSKLLGDLFDQQQTDTHSDIVTKEIEVCKAEKPAELDFDHSPWWHQRKSFYSPACTIVPKMYSFISASVPSVFV